MNDKYKMISWLLGRLGNDARVIAQVACWVTSHMQRSLCHHWFFEIPPMCSILPWSLIAIAALGNLGCWHSWPELTTVHRAMKRMRSHVKEPGIGMEDANPIIFNLSDLAKKLGYVSVSLFLLFFASLSLSLYLPPVSLHLSLIAAILLTEIMHMHATNGQYFQDCNLSFIWSYQESGGCVHPDTLRPGSISGKNDDHDFWPCCGLAWTKWPADCCMSGRCCLGTGAYDHILLPNTHIDLDFDLQNMWTWGDDLFEFFYIRTYLIMIERTHAVLTTLSETRNIPEWIHYRPLSTHITI